jgi:hypothetical protein
MTVKNLRRPALVIALFNELARFQALENQAFCGRGIFRLKAEATRVWMANFSASFRAFLG